jgi:hypothetical protein
MSISRRGFLAGGGAAAMALRFGPIWAEEKSTRAGLRVLAECETVFFGASAFAVAASSRDPERCIMIDRGLSPASEFSGALLPNVLTEDVSSSAKEIRAAIERENLAANGLYHTPPVTDIVSGFILKKKLNIFLNAEILSVRRVSSGYEVEVIGSDGLSILRCRRILDTTPQAWRELGMDALESRYLSAALVGKAKRPLSDFSVKDGELHPGALEGETYFRVKLPVEFGWTRARLKLHETFEAFASLPDCPFKMGAEATEFGYSYHSQEVSKRIDENWDWLPGARYRDLMAALNGGELWS